MDSSSNANEAPLPDQSSATSAVGSSTERESKEEIFLVEMVNSNWIVCLRPEDLGDSWLLKRPTRLVVQQGTNGLVPAMAPYIYFLPKEVQKLGLVRVSKAHVMMMAPLDEVVHDGGRLEELYTGMFSTIVRARALPSQLGLVR